MEEFNAYFHYVLNESSSYIYPDPSSETVSDTDFTFSSVTLVDIHKAIQSFRKQNKRYMEVILPYLAGLYNFSIISSTFPDLWEKWHIRPIPRIKSPVSSKSSHSPSLLYTSNRNKSALQLRKYTKHCILSKSIEKSQIRLN